MRSIEVGLLRHPHNPNCLCEYRESEQLTLGKIELRRFWLYRIGPLPNKPRPSIRRQNDLHGRLLTEDRQIRTNYLSQDSSGDGAIPSPSSRSLLTRQQSTY